MRWHEAGNPATAPAPIFSPCTRGRTPVPRARGRGTGDDGGEGDEGLAQQEGRTVSLAPVVEPHGGPGRLGRTARRQGVIDDGEASRPAGLAPDNATQRPPPGPAAGSAR